MSEQNYNYKLTSKFSGFTSLCIIPIPCRYLRALAKLNTIPLASLSVYLVAKVMASNKSPPFENEQIKYC